MASNFAQSNESYTWIHNFVLSWNRVLQYILHNIKFVFTRLKMKVLKKHSHPIPRYKKSTCSCHWHSTFCLCCSIESCWSWGPAVGWWPVYPAQELELLTRTHQVCEEKEKKNSRKFFAKQYLFNNYLQQYSYISTTFIWSVWLQSFSFRLTSGTPLVLIVFLGLHSSRYNNQQNSDH